MTSLERIKGEIISIVYYNDANGYTVADINMQGKLVTVVGFFPELQEGEQVTLMGKWVVHPDYGTQFKAENFEWRFPPRWMPLKDILPPD